ncbi:complement C1q tumor necrosis factor-related protein 3-like [Ostrea edulis]|uniref:complement C1q tumor necrosis factor-related protein 3-like n=1 Tax=Ostrea edulis TaxID=37623 RepID=UPI002094F1D4|nr:complement C1q tumor necrosis factor-related protein 3-like [Ostrea edulis]
MISMLMLRGTLVLMGILTELYAKETTQDFISKYNNYNTVCRGMGYETRSCKGRNHGATAFHARIPSHLKNLGNRAVVVFRKVTLNSGSAYDGNTGIFTAPRDGIYSFTWTIMTIPGSTFHTEIVINGKLVGYNYADGKNGSSHFESSSATAMIRMKKKDKVWIRTHGGYGKYAHADWSSFSGFEL